MCDERNRKRKQNKRLGFLPEDSTDLMRAKLLTHSNNNYLQKPVHFKRPQIKVRTQQFKKKNKPRPTKYCSMQPKFWTFSKASEQTLEIFPIKSKYQCKCRISHIWRHKQCRKHCYRMLWQELGKTTEKKKKKRIILSYTFWKSRPTWDLTCL